MRIEERGEEIFSIKKQDTLGGTLFFLWKEVMNYFKMLANLANSRSLATFVAKEASLAIALLILLLTNDSLLVRAPTIAIK